MYISGLSYLGSSFQRKTVVSMAFAAGNTANVQFGANSPDPMPDPKRLNLEQIRAERERLRRLGAGNLGDRDREYYYALGKEEENINELEQMYTGEAPAPDTSGSRDNVQPLEDNKSRAGGDPHFVGPQKQRYDVSGISGRWHDIYSTPDTQLNGLFTCPRGVPGIFSNRWGWAGTRITKTVLNTSSGDHLDLDFKKPPAIVHNEKAIRMEPGKRYTLNDGAIYVEWQSGTKTLHVETPTVVMALKAYRFGLPLAHLSEKSEFAPQYPVTSGKVQPHGILGQLDATQRVNKYGKDAHQNGDRGLRAQGGGVLEMYTPDGVLVLNPLNSHGDTAAVEQYITTAPGKTDDRFSQMETYFR